MKSYLFLVAGTALSLASCSESKTTETTATAGTAGDSTAMKSSMTSYNDEAYKSRSKRIADKYAADMKITDPAMREKISTAYYNRSKRYGEMKTKYASDTTGMGAAMRDYNTATDAEFKSIYTDPAQYKSYESSRTNYNEDTYVNNDASSSSAPSSMSPDSSSTTSSSPSGSAMSGTTDDNATGSSSDGATAGGTVSKSKTKLTDGTKIKVKGDGQVKVKDADGSKMKQ